MLRYVLSAWFPIGVVTGLTLGSDQGVQDRHPVYVGVRVCTACHAGQDAGHQYSLWRTSKHARAYASLWSPAAKRIAELSGIFEEPQEAPVCLGCHATAFDAEGWEKEDTFVYEDGVQCERCHGAGSEYIEPEVMADREKAIEAGLRIPDKSLCMVCHNTKGSHVAVLQSPVLTVEERLETIAHPAPLPGGTRRAVESEADSDTLNVELRHRHFIGVQKCAECHSGPTMGYQFSRWRDGPHARAYAVLATKAGYEMAKAEGIAGDPQKSPRCLRCHATGADVPIDRLHPSFDVRDGVQCEGCHGSGSDYWPEAVMRDPRAARQAGLVMVTEATCRTCHEKAHGRPFEYAEALAEIAHPTRFLPSSKQVEVPRYKTPLNLALSPDGKELYIACEASNTVIVVDVSRQAVLAEIATGGQPTDVTFSPDGSRAYVTNRHDDTVVEIDTKTRRVLTTLPVGDEPHGVLADQTGRWLYVLNTSADSISVLDAGTMTEAKRLTASSRPWSLALSPDGRTILVTNILSRLVAFRTPSVSEVTVIDTESGTVSDRIEVPGANLMQGIAWHPSGDFALATLNRTKNLMPMTRLMQGWTITNGMAVIWRDGRVDQVLLDEPDQCFPDPTDVAISPDGRYALVTSSGSDRVAVVDVSRLISTLENASAFERKRVLPNHLGKPTEFVLEHIPTMNSPRGLVFSHDGATAYVANALDDSVTVIDMARLEAVDRIDLGGPKMLSKTRYGERLFHSAEITFHRQFSCRTCHPDGHVNGLTFDIEPDGIGIAPVDNRTLRGILDTAPFKWEGTNPTLQRQCGPRLAVFFTRIQPFTPEELSALETYICTIPRPPNRYRAVGALLTPAQRRGKAMFERTVTNDGRAIAVDKRCVSCHPPPYYTNRSRRDVGTKMWLDRESEFDVPHLNNIYDSAPYLHNGISETLEEIWTRFNPYDRHSVTNDMTKDQLNDLIEFLKTL